MRREPVVDLLTARRARRRCVAGPDGSGDRGDAAELRPLHRRVTLPGDPDVAIGAIDVLPDGRAILATWDMTGTVDPPPPTEILIFD